MQDARTTKDWQISQQSIPNGIALTESKDYWSGTDDDEERGLQSLSRAVLLFVNLQRKIGQKFGDYKIIT